MKVTVRLFGAWGQRYPGYDPQKGLEMAFPEGARVGVLLARLGLRDENKPVVVVDGLIRHPQDELSEGVVVNVMQAVYGG